MDLIAELRAGIARLAERYGGARYHSQRGITLPAAVVAPNNPLAATVNEPHDTAFATGYDSGTGLTQVPFQWGVSGWNDGDVWTGS